MYDIARRHAVRVLKTRGERLEQATWVEGAFEVRFYTGNRAFSRGEFAAVLRNTRTEGQLTLSVREPGDMSADDLDGLVADLKGMLESQYGRRPCRADPATGVCDAPRAALEESAEAWLRARQAAGPVVDRPVTHVAWAEAEAYAAWLSKTTGETYRLPSEAEWEWAARAGAGTAYHWGNDAGRRRALCVGCSGKWPPDDWVATVGSYPANAWGLHDMHGNAAEWTADCWREDHLDAPSDGSARADGDCPRRVVCGGSYETYPRAVRSAARAGRTANERYLDVGFRVLRELRNAGD